MTTDKDNKIAVVDYGAGNLHSVFGALARVGAAAYAAQSPRDLAGCGGIVLPGVGAFGYAAAKLGESGFDSALCESVQKGVPLLGICLGMQLLFARSEESPGAKGLGLLPGEVRLLRTGNLKTPHMGWTNLHVCGGKLMHGIQEGTFAYFVHSFAVHGKHACATAEYGEIFDAAVECGNVFGTQFHPEKSSLAGKRILHNFISVCKGGAL